MNAPVAPLSMPELQFELTLLEPADAPPGCEGLWHRYVISQGTNTIKGLRAGSREEIGLQLQDMLMKLNQRAWHHRAKAKR